MRRHWLRVAARRAAQGVAGVAQGTGTSGTGTGGVPVAFRPSEADAPARLHRLEALHQGLAAARIRALGSRAPAGRKKNHPGRDVTQANAAPMLGHTRTPQAYSSLQAASSQGVVDGISGASSCPNRRREADLARRTLLLVFRGGLRDPEGTWRSFTASVLMRWAEGHSGLSWLPRWR